MERTTVFSRTITGSVETAVALSNCTIARAISLPTTWSNVRIGLRMDFTNGGSNMSGYPRMGVGLCSGETNLVGDYNTTYFVGVVSSAETWTYSPSSNDVYYNIFFTPATKSGSVLVTGSSMGSDIRFANNSVKNTHFLLDIFKRGATYAFGIYTNMAANPNYSTSASFTRLLQTTRSLLPVTNDFLGWYQLGTTQSIAVNEASSGSLDHVTVWWGRTEVQLNLEDLAVVCFN